MWTTIYSLVRYVISFALCKNWRFYFYTTVEYVWLVGLTYKLLMADEGPLHGQKCQRRRLRHHEELSEEGEELAAAGAEQPPAQGRCWWLSLGECEQWWELRRTFRRGPTLRWKENQPGGPDLTASLPSWGTAAESWQTRVYPEADRSSAIQRPLCPGLLKNMLAGRNTTVSKIGY